MVNIHQNASWWVGLTCSHLSVFADSNFFPWFSAPFLFHFYQFICIASFKTRPFKYLFRHSLPRLPFMTFILYYFCPYGDVCHKFNIITNPTKLTCEQNNCFPWDSHLEKSHTYINNGVIATVISGAALWGSLLLHSSGSINNDKSNLCRWFQKFVYSQVIVNYI